MSGVIWSVGALFLICMVSSLALVHRDPCERFQPGDQVVDVETNLTGYIGAVRTDTTIAVLYESIASNHYLQQMESCKSIEAVRALKGVRPAAPAITPQGSSHARASLHALRVPR